MRGKILMVLLVAILLLPALNITPAQAEAIKSSTPLSFIKNFPVVQREDSLGASGITIDVTVNSTFTYRGDMVLLTNSSNKYAEKGNSTTLTIDVLNAISILELSGDVTISLSYILGSLDIPLRVIDIKYSATETMGTPQHIIMGEYLLYSVTFYGFQVSIFMRPVVEYTPILSGDLLIQGSASATSTSLIWNQNSIQVQLNFSASEPVDTFLGDPQLTLEELKVIIQIYAVIASIPTPSVDFEVVELGDYAVSSSTVHLISFEPNYYELYRELKESYSTLASTLEQVQQSLENLTPSQVDLDQLNATITTLTQDLEDLESQIDQLSAGTPQLIEQPLILVAIGLAAISLVLASYSAWRAKVR